MPHRGALYIVPDPPSVYQGTAESTVPGWGSGAGGSRTPDLRRAKAALSQLSYGPWYPSHPVHSTHD